MNKGPDVSGKNKHLCDDERDGLVSLNDSSKTTLKSPNLLKKFVKPTNKVSNDKYMPPTVNKNEKPIRHANQSKQNFQNKNQNTCANSHAQVHARQKQALDRQTHQSARPFRTPPTRSMSAA
ncbi:MAG: hypothetical protein Q8755_03375, partial [Candidatus Phytoplasma australasiaticum]|nr:hypothetical protein [Candidatus Phytoplasma australasiaticum]